MVEHIHVYDRTLTVGNWPLRGYIEACLCGALKPPGVPERRPKVEANLKWERDRVIAAGLCVECCRPREPHRNALCEACLSEYGEDLDRMSRLGFEFQA